MSEQQLLRLDDADIGVDHIAEAGLLLRQQRGALGHHLVLGAVDVARGLAAGVERLGELRLRDANEPVGLRVQEPAARKRWAIA